MQVVMSNNPPQLFPFGYLAQIEWEMVEKSTLASG